MMELADLLEAAGFRCVPLTRSEVGHFHAPATLRGREVSALIDTGAGCTLVSLVLARELGLGLTPMAEKGAGAGSAALDMFTVEETPLDLGGVQLRPACLVAMDLGHANAAMLEKGVAPIEAIVGLDVFEAHAAVIDYGSQSLFLRP